MEHPCNNFSDHVFDVCLGIFTAKKREVNIYAYIIIGMCSSFLLCAATILFYFRYRKNILAKQYEMKTAELQYQKDLLKASITTQEAERKRIGMDLHDEVGSKLSALRLLIENYADVNTEQLSEQAFNQKCKFHIDNVITNVRNISHDLSPVIRGGYGLYDILMDFAEDVNKSGKINVLVKVDEAAENTTLEDFVQLSLYRVIVELLNNTIKHAEAKQAEIHFSVLDNQYILQYDDDGKGIDTDLSHIKKGIGFKNMESRLESIGANFQLMQTNEPGFHLKINLPLV
ncbi:MAG: hypothetical protein DI598_09265 [Pseudopedobacter saltans]|uniref:histidine kinase n=1 Tax=Pseudopedobacter saltans TaxID=151895 RepID=A0A2W5F068_9SPHI|nr:MAG: hypothetical protein DI598_09265 [Pseudopedobacter saltans]